MIGLALSGGGSRAIAFHLGCLRALNDLGILGKVGALSTISGGSVIGAYYAYSPSISFKEFDADVCQLLRHGFHKSIILELLKPWNSLPCLSNRAAVSLESLFARVRGIFPKHQRYPSRTDIFHKVLERDVFSGLKMNSPRRDNLEVIIGACDLRTGTAFRFGNTKSGAWQQGEIVDGNVEVGFAVAASAAFPILLPALDRTWKFRKHGTETQYRVLLTDGGVYDNLGLQVLEPDRDSTKSLHAFPCNYLIVCNAGTGRSTGMALPLNYVPQVARAFEITHQRVQVSAMRRLHHLKEAGKIKGFILPYLGQQDGDLPVIPQDFVRHSEVSDYPTNFAAMSEEWISKLSGRGESLTRTLVEHYCPELL